MEYTKEYLELVKAGVICEACGDHLDEDEQSDSRLCDFCKEFLELESDELED